MHKHCSRQGVVFKTRTQPHGPVCCSFLGRTDCSTRHTTFSPLLTVARNQVWSLSSSMREKGQLSRIKNTTRLWLTAKILLEMYTSSSSCLRGNGSNPRLCGDMQSLAQCRQHAQAKKNEDRACSTWELGTPAGSTSKRLVGVHSCHTASSPNHSSNIVHRSLGGQLSVHQTIRSCTQQTQFTPCCSVLPRLM